MATNQINTIIVLRNDSTTNWENSDYKLLSGEVGVGYMTRTIGEGEAPTEKKVQIIKVGDGVNKWADLPQAEGVFENDQILTYNFGRHTISNGFVNAGGRGMTTSEWLIDALAVTEEPAITKPDASMTASFTPSSGETGTAITKVNWAGTFTDGTYEYGSVETKDFPNGTDAEKAAKKKANASATWVVKFGNTQIGTTEDGSYAQSLVMGDTQTKVTLSAEATLVTTNVRTPLNNIGAETTGKVTTFADGSTKKTFSPAATVTGYRRMFCGCTSETLTSDVIRGLNLKNESSSVKGVKAAKGTFEVTAPVNATQIVLALPTNSMGKKYTMTKAEMYTSNWEDYTSLFSSAQTVQVADKRGGTNGLQDYNVYTYSFAALKANTRFQFTVAEANA